MISVIKIGGSLFDLPDLKQRIETLLMQIEGHKIIIPGGGKLTDVIRFWDQTHQLGEAVSHQVALQSLSISAAMLASFNVDYELTDRLERTRQIWNENKTPVLDPCELILNHSPLPQNWEVTSDSIAAWTSTQLNGATLILAKSVDPPDSKLKMEEWSQQGYVDPSFEKFANPLSHIQWCNLRANASTIIDVKTSASE